MKIDYFCFSVPRLGLTDYCISENDDENTIWIKTKEKELMDGKEVIDIIEYNSISSSGLEVCNLLVDELIKQEQSPHFVKKRFN